MKNFIKKIFFIILVILVGSCAKESKMKNSTYSNLFKSGTTIVYEVASWGDMYILKIEIEKINGDLIFRYTLSDENGDTTFQDREITVSKKSLESSEKIFMNLWDGDIVDIKGKTSIFFSKKVFREL
ncbi:TPA: hypothetical protein DIT23_02955, partial [candidate division WOR-3 bacterium]|nr:hypothetical protein [candidate division WOR-3 bacterium]